MRFLTEDAVLVCKHELGQVGIAPTQDLVTVEDRRVLVRSDPEGKPIAGCPNAGPTIKPCTTTLPVKKGYSSLVSVGGRPICLETVEGLTDGTPPGTVKYHVRTPGQSLVESSR